MEPVLKVGPVLGGYLAAGVLASVAVAARIAVTSGADAQASSGMYAFGDALLFAGVFTAVSLVPTGAGLYFLRPYPRVWSFLSIVSLAVAFTGVLAAVLFTAGRHLPPSPLSTAAQLSVLRLLVAPLLAAVMCVCALFCPTKRSRLPLFLSAFLEVAVST